MKPDFRIAGPFIAWRCWRADLAEGILLPSFFIDDHVWPAGEALHAKCLSGHVMTSHETPSLRCSCGIYGYRNAEDALDRYSQALETRPVDRWAIPVVGRVSLWGKVVEHERGWRSSLAYPYELKIPRELHQYRVLPRGEILLEEIEYDPDGMASKLRRNYVVDVEVL